MLKKSQDQSYDAIVIGTGISGGWAAKELCERGLRTLVLERGPMVRHVQDYPTMNLAPWELPYGNRLTREEREEKYFVQGRKAYAVTQDTKHFFVRDDEHPYVETKPFDWIRGYQVGGRSLTWGRQCYRISDLDFEANAKEGIAVDWPIRYADIAPWYDYVESFIGVSGQAEGLPQVPDGQFLPPFEMNCVERQAKQRIESAFPERCLTIGRTAHLTRPHNGRGQCQSRNLCRRGCPYGAYFSSNSSTLPAAEKTGRMTLRPDSIVTSIIYDEQNDVASGVRVIDAVTGETREFFSKIVFCNASTLGSTHILLNSVSNRFPNGLGNSSGELGHNLMDHPFAIGAVGVHEGFDDKYFKGNRPTGIYIPRFRNLGDSATRRDDYLRGFHYQGGASRQNWTRYISAAGTGAELKEQLSRPGPWRMGIEGYGEHLPEHENRVELNFEVKDRWDQPTLAISCSHGENERVMRKDMGEAAAEMLEAAGLRDVRIFDIEKPPGNNVHEMGTARMGRDPKTSVLNGFNQMHDVPNVFVSDGACMTSSPCQNPSITYMALTARACAHAVEELKRGNL